MQEERKRLFIQITLFIVTVITTTIAGAEWMYSKMIFFTEPTMSWDDFMGGFEFSIPFLLILTCHEFGHYFTARYHDVKVTLPYYIPLWLGFIAYPSFGTMGAMIRIREQIYSLKHYFDIGVSGPIAGFVVAMGVIWYGFTHLPEPEYIFQVHPEYEQYGLDYADHVYDEEVISFQFGNNIIYWFFENYVADPERMPNPNEMIHYPWLLAGYLALFFTALNLLPIGQLDGGHIIFGLFGFSRHRSISKVLFTLFLFYAGLGLITVRDLEDISTGSTLGFLVLLLGYLYFLYICTYSLFSSKYDRWLYAAVMLTLQFVISYLFDVEGYSGWLLFALLLGRVMGLGHPPVLDNTPLSTGRRVIGWIALIIFIISFSPEPFVLIVPE